METVKFTFEEDFSTETVGGSYTKKMQQLSDDAFLQGKEEGFAEAINSIEKNCELILNDIQQAVSVIMSRHEEQIATMEKQATSMVLAIIKKLAPAMVKEKPLEEIENLVQECMKNNPSEPRLVIRVDEQILPHLRRKIDTIQTASDYNGQVVLVSEQMGNISDCRVEWLDGGAERDFNSILNSIEEMVQKFIEAPLPNTENTGTSTQEPVIEAFTEAPIK